ncbi:hypothetical protein BC360_30175 [Ensifer sp. LC163]|nr:hypothetical protein BC360_30175 [Ensifer sp. LC163]
MIWCPPIFWWTLHASEHCASEGAQKFALTLMWPILLRCILPLQTIADHIDDTTDDTLVIDTRIPMRKRKMRRYASHLALA